MISRTAKLAIRLPTDTGPNPYDSRTPTEDLPPADWIIAVRNSSWWLAIFLYSLVWVGGQMLKGHIS